MAEAFKLKKSEVDYSPGKGEERCANCEHYLDPRRCELVEGDIDPTYWCEEFEIDDDEDPATTLRAALAETWAFYFQSASFHWNVTGRDFPQLHDLFGRLYSDAQNAVDGLAEQLRSLGEFAPSSLAEIDEGSKITFADKPPDSQAMVKKLAGDNEIVLGALDAAQHAASDADQQGLANYLQDRINTHRKWGWMLKATESEASVKDIANQKNAPGSERLGKLLGAIKPEPKAVDDAEDEAPADGEGA